MATNKGKKQQALPNKECFSRMNFLYQAATLMAGRNNKLSSFYGTLCRNVGKKAVLRIDPQVKRNLCKRCSLALKPIVTANVEVQQQTQRRTGKRNRQRRRKPRDTNIDRNAQLQVMCRQCGYKRNFNLNGDYNFWLEQPECVAEVQTVDKHHVVAMSDKGQTASTAYLNNNELRLSGQPVSQHCRGRMHERQQFVVARHLRLMWRKNLLGGFHRPDNAIKRLLNASVVGDGHYVTVDEGGQKKEPLKFPSIWLRDNCQCTDCFHDNTKSRKVNWERCNVGVRAESASAASNNRITIAWSDKHVATFQLDWLRARDFAPANRQRYMQEIYKPAAQLWSKQQFQGVLKTFDFGDVIGRDDVLLAWLEALAQLGFAMLKNAPKDVTVARQLANRIGFIKRTTYGEEFEVKSKENARNYAYLMTPLPLHTDMPYYEYKAGINILHCLVQSQSTGGANLITDGFNVAEVLRREFPKYFQLLLKTPVDWYDIGKDGEMAFHSIWRAPVINLDVDGAYARINHNITKRDSHFTVPLEQVIAWYEAYDKFLQLAYEQAVEFKTQPGDVFVFNNLRMLHGRTAYEDSSENKRHLIGAYVDWDIIYSKMRILKKQQQSQ